ncbi:MAG: dioxygenase, partial [Gammaproteobacteria bacterium]|nr:dioxygenase [Gammaproteobacteria bacterium]
MSTLPSYFISHGGGPWSYMDGPFRRQFDRLEQALKAIPSGLEQTPQAILMISGHWQTEGFHVMANGHPPMVYDYSGFPEHTYDIVYPAPGAPQLAQKVMEMLQSAGLPSALDHEQGFDHGCFVPMSVMYPEAQMPVIQMSLQIDNDPALHIRAGEALAPLREQGVLIMASGLSYHNLRRMGAEAAGPSAAFDAWLQDSLVGRPAEFRRQRLNQWETAPAAREAHPHEDHLLPLMVAAGA